MGRLQGAELQEMSDQGMCISVQQPWASLLVCGLKPHEGRNWYTPHRGRLWIHAASKQPSVEEINYANELCKTGDKKFMQFLTQLPTGCLLGYVELKDVIPQEEYALNYEKHFSDSPFVFICEDHQELQVKFPMQGKPKIFRLDKVIHQAAKKAQTKEGATV